MINEEVASGFAENYGDIRSSAAPNSNYPLFIVASKDRKKRVFEKLNRPTFSGPCLRLNEVIGFLGYDKVREIDESSRNTSNFDSRIVLSASEAVT